MRLTILTLWTSANTIRQNRLRVIEITPNHIHALICDESGQMLSHALAHDASLAMVYVEPLLSEDGGNVRGEAFHSPRQIIPS